VYVAKFCAPPPPGDRFVLTLMWIVEDARPMAGKYLVKWRPGFVEAHSGQAAVSAPVAVVT